MTLLKISLHLNKRHLVFYCFDKIFSNPTLDVFIGPSSKITTVLQNFRLGSDHSKQVQWSLTGDGTALLGSSDQESLLAFNAQGQNPNHLAKQLHQ